MLPRRGSVSVGSLLGGVEHGLFNGRFQPALDSKILFVP